MGEMDDDPIMVSAWHAAVLAAFQDDGAHRAFRGATGRPQASRTGTVLDGMIDKAIGGAVDDAYMIDFVDWFTREHWGEDCAPKKWQERNATRSARPCGY